MINLVDDQGMWLVVRADKADQLYKALTKDYPAPWRLEYHVIYPEAVARIISADGTCPLTLETHTGDGDRFDLGSAGAEALVAFVNGLTP